MDHLNRVVKIEADSTAINKIQAIYSKCGEIIGLYPCKTGTSANVHCFIKFKDNQSSQHAINLKVDIPGIRVYGLYRNPHLAEQFRAADFEENNVCIVGSQNYSNPITASTKHPHRKQTRKKQRSKWYKERPQPPPHSPAGDVASHSSSGAANYDDFFCQAVKIDQPHVSQRVASSMNSSTKCSDRMITSNASSALCSLSPPSDALRATSASFSLSNEILLTFRGEEIRYNLNGLEPDARFVIELLRLTSSERGGWMMVGAYYRRSGNARAAISVMMSMIEAMAQHGISDDELKPAFLLLSGCEIDLARRTTNDDVTMAEHYRKSRMWLQKVYGNNSSSSNPKIHTRPTPVYVDPQQGLLEREVQSLRIHRDHVSSLLAESRAAKRKLEDDLMIERDFRRKIQRYLDDAERELDQTRKTEMYALDQVRREVEARRKAEETIIALRKIAEQKLVP